jgi:hypothetical protein
MLIVSAEVLGGPGLVITGVLIGSSHELAGRDS